jgi:hypothetical protein
MAYTEFYCQNGGSNLNAGSTTNNTAAYTSTNGNWSTTTNIFIPTDGSTPASFISVGDWVSIYIDGATIAVYIARVTAVAAGVNGGITVSSTAKAGVAPTTSTTTRSLKAGGAWQGPNGTSAFPFTLSGFGNNTDTSAHRVRVNMKNDQTYSITTGLALTGASSIQKVVQGYSSSVGDGGKATWDGFTSSGSLISSLGVNAWVFVDLIFTTSITSGNISLVNVDGSSVWIRCVFHGARNQGFQCVAGCTLIECEAYDCNKANQLGIGAFDITGAAFLSRCIAHDNAGSNTSGFVIQTGLTTLQNCISETNGKYGILINGSVINGSISINQCDIYNNASDGINIISSVINNINIENTNLIKNGGAGINNVSTINTGFTYNVGYGAGTQANTSADTLNGIIQSGNVTYASNVTPWIDPTNGDFRINLSAAIGAGRGAFTQTAASYAGAVGHPDIGAVEALVTGSSVETSHSFG